MNILIVEDDIVIAEVIQQALEKVGYHSVHVTTIEKALIEMNHNLIDAVLLDINLPDGDGTSYPFDSPWQAVNAYSGCVWQ